MSLLADIRMYSRFAAGLPRFFLNTLTVEQAHAIVRRRMEGREWNFLRLVAKGVFGYLKSPYLPLMKMAACELGDIERMVRSKGIEATLEALRAAGVYVRFEEFKGREPIVRDGKTFPVRAKDFDNPYLSRYYYVQTGGSTGPGTRLTTDLDHLADRAPYLALAFQAHGILNVPSAQWRAGFPGTGLNGILTRARFGNTVQRWFTPVDARDLKPQLKYGLATWTVIRTARAFGVPMPTPEPVRLQDAAVVARWIAETLKIHGQCALNTNVSMALRVCVAAQEEGLDFKGASILVSGEPPSPAKVRQIEQTGARCIPAYWVSEAGLVGFGCVNPHGENDNHFFHDALALIQHATSIPGSDSSVGSFYITSLLPSAPKLLLNVEVDDYGVVEERQCGCYLEKCGYNLHIRDIHSLRKLTGEGMTIVGADMIRILEEELPSRFGGSALDYQLVEKEEGNGLTKVSIVVSPRVHVPSEEAVIEAVLQCLAKGDPGSRLARAVWGQAGTLEVKRTEPVWTSQGKLLTLRVDRSGGR